MRGSAGALSGAAGALLSPRLLPTAGNLGPGQGVSRAYPLIRLELNDGLVNQAFVHGLSKYVIGELSLSDHLAGQIVD